MAISINPSHLKRYKDIAWLLVKHGRSDFVRHAHLQQFLNNGETVPDSQTVISAQSLAADLEQLGPTFVKLGQLLSTRADFLPLPYLEALARLQDCVTPFSADEAASIIAEELGLPVSRIYARFDPIPIAAASLGQVHRATLISGEPVAVKVQRPHVRNQVSHDLACLMELAEFVDEHTETGRRYGFRHMVDEFRRTILNELDYRKEAQNLIVLGANLCDFESIVVPYPVAEYTTSRVLTMQWVQGQKIGSLGRLAIVPRDGCRLADELFRAYLQQILVDGLFHADPHPGNVFLTSDSRIALLDLGMVGRVTPAVQDRLLQLLIAVSESRTDEVVELAGALGQPREGFDSKTFARRISDLVLHQAGETAERIEVGRLMLEFVQTSVSCGLRLPSELTMLGKALLNLDQIGRTLDPSFDPNAALRRQAAGILQQRLTKSLSPGNLFSSLIETKDFLQKLPSRANRILDHLANNRLEVRVDAIDEKELIEGIQKIANRITLGLVLAALIIGAALLMRVETSFRILGYPGFAILCYLAAAIGGMMLMVSILLHDRRSGGGKRPRG